MNDNTVHGMRRSGRKEGLVAMAMLALATPFTSGREAKAATLEIVPVIEPSDVLGTPDRPGPSFMVAASLTVEQDIPLDFGTVLAPSGGTGNLTVNPSTGAKSYDTANSIISSDASTSAHLTVGGGHQGSTYLVGLPSSGSVGSFSLTSFTKASPDNYTFNASGESTLEIGATVAIPANAAPGSYTGTSGSLTALELSQFRVGQAALTGIALKLAKPMSLSTVTNLGFGDVVAGTTAGTVVMTPTGGRTSTGGVTLGATASSAAGKFSLTGESGADFAVTVSPTTLSLTGPGTAMTVDTWSVTPSSGTLSSGAQTIAVGGTLHVGAKQTSGSYSGIFTISTNYQ